MARREGNRKQILEVLSDEVAKTILELQDGDEMSIAQIVSSWYQSQGYAWKHLDIDHGYVWTKDGGSTYAITDFDQIEVLEIVTKRLEGVCELDFRKYDGMVVGLPYNLFFTVRRVK